MVVSVLKEFVFSPYLQEYLFMCRVLVIVFSIIEVIAAFLQITHLDSLLIIFVKEFIYIYLSM